ncbi:MAG: ATP-binding protein [Eubacteriales bacterium]
MDENNEIVEIDGVPYCSVCKEPLEKKFPNGPVLGRDRFPRMCACQRKAYEEREAEYEERQRVEQISRYRNICFEEKKMHNWKFENDDGTTASMDIARKYVANWKQMRRDNIGFLFWGPIGTGKSYVAGCIANALIEQEVTVKMTNFTTIIDDMFALSDKTEYINQLARYDLLIIDDLGAERSSDYAIGIVFSVIDRRWRSGRPLIITTNMAIKTIKEEFNLDKKRIYDRILEMCTPVYVGGESKRIEVANQKLEIMKSRVRGR